MIITQPSQSQSVNSVDTFTDHHIGDIQQLQQKLSKENPNLPFGNLISSPKQPNTTRIFYKNINGLLRGKSWSLWEKFSQEIKTNHIDICGVTETNIRWDTRTTSRAKTFIQKHTRPSHINTSSHSETTTSLYQPGGTLTATTGKTTGKISSKINDTSGMGRWSGFQYATSHGSHFNIITVYQSTVSDGIGTTYQQQYHTLKLQGHENPNPRKILLNDLTKLINKFNLDGDKTIVLIDANDNLTTNSSLLTSFLSNTQMTSLIHEPQHHPPTHIRGSKCIDFILGSYCLLDHIEASGISAFYDPPWSNSDHRGLFVDIQTIGIFGATIHTIIPNPIRSVTSKSKKVITKFLAEIEKQNKINTLLQQIQSLHQVEHWTSATHAQLENIDAQFTKTLLTSEKSSAPPADLPWSNTLHVASQIYNYWSISHYGEKNNINVEQQLQQIITTLPEEEILQFNNSRTITHQLQLSRKHLINCRLNAQELRDKFIDVLQDKLIESGNTTKAEVLRKLANKERQLSCWRTFKVLRKGNKSSGGISHILIKTPTQNTHTTTGHIQQTPTQYTRIQGKTDLDAALLERNIKHFRQAHGTPFTTSPLIEILGDNGCNEAALAILNGKIPDGISKYPKLILQKLKRVRHSIPLIFTLEDMSEGFRKWKEQTTTSPSGKHLGIYKALVIAHRHNILTDKESKLHSTNNNFTSLAHKCLLIQHSLLTLSIKHCHTYRRWTIVHNFLLEKIPGVPTIDKLRVIHLYEADWSIIQKFYVAHKLTRTACTQNTVPVEQAGGRPGRSSIELAASRVITYEIMKLQRLTGSVLYNDAKACFDRMVENITNLALMKQGLPTEIAQLHSQTFTQMEYHIKHQLGIGTQHHSHNNPSPIYGSGQGASDAPARWAFMCDLLIEVYKDWGSDAIIKSPIGNHTTNQKISGFVDDISTLQIRHVNTIKFLILLLQTDTQLWEQLLHTSGGKLEIEKCRFALIKWYFDKKGVAQLLNTQPSLLHVKDSDTNKIQHIPQINTSTSYKYVGVHLAVDGNMRAQIEDTKQKCQDMGSIFSQCYFSAKDANQGFNTIYTPSVKYPLPVTSMKQDILTKLQRPVIGPALARLGYNRHMPRAVVFSAKLHGGIGLLDLSTEQSASQINLLISHLRTNTYLTKSIYILLESYQIAAGITGSPLQDTTPCPYVDSPWVTSIRNFLHNTNTSIITESLQSIHLLRQHDRPIMHKIQNRFNKSEMECINACRLFLQVNLLSEICDDSGTTLLTEALYGNTTNNKQPTLWIYSTSTLHWPHQECPPSQSWALWKRHLSYFTNNTTKLTTPLGDWTTNPYRQRKWYFNYTTKGIHRIQEQCSTFYTPVVSRTRHNKKFTISNEAIHNFDPTSIPITPTYIQKETIHCRIPTTIRSKAVTTPRSDLQYEVLIGSDIIYKQEQTLTIAFITTHTHKTQQITSHISDSNNNNIITQFDLPTRENFLQISAIAYGILLPLHHIQQIMNNQLQELTIQIFFPSQQGMKSLLKATYKHPTPSQTMAPEWDLLVAASNILKQCKMFRIYHKDMDDINEAAATIFDDLHNYEFTQHQSTNNHKHTYTHKTIHLRHSNKRVSGNYTQRIREINTTQAIQDYMQTKYRWNEHTFNDIEWRVHGKTLTSLPQRQQKTITQFIHKWLPTNASHSFENIGTARLCPYCQSTDEDQSHFLSCTHTTSSKQWIEASTKITTNLTSFNKKINPQIIHLITMAITVWRNTPHPTQPEFLNTRFTTLFHNQSIIGWDQVLAGRFSKSWRKFLPLSYHSANQWLSYATRQIWLALYEIWKERCATQHGKTEQEKDLRIHLTIEPQIQSLFTQQHDPNITHLFKQPLEETLLLPTQSLLYWTQKVTTRMRTYRLSQRQKHNKHTSTNTPIFSNCPILKHMTIKHKVKYQKKKNLLPTTLTSFFPKIRPKTNPISRITKEDLHPP
jgi:hypothetical protein